MQNNSAMSGMIGNVGGILGASIMGNLLTPPTGQGEEENGDAWDGESANDGRAN